MEALINGITADQVDTDAKLKTECEKIMNNESYKEVCKAALNAKVKGHHGYVHSKPSDNSNT